MQNIVVNLEKAFYKLHKRIEFQGLKISIENRKGSVRSGIDKDGHKWRSKMFCDYGYIRMSPTVRRQGADKEGLDVFVGPNKESDKVFIIHLMRADDPSKFDEDKAFIGFNSRKEVMAMFKKCYDKLGQKLYGGMINMNMEAFKRRLEVQTTRMIKSIHGEPFQIIVFPEPLEKSHVKAHFRRDDKGKLHFIKDYDDKRHKKEVHHTIKRGEKYEVDNPKSKHHGKVFTANRYHEPNEKTGKAHYVAGHVDGKKSDLKPHHLKPIEGSKSPKGGDKTALSSPGTKKTKKSDSQPSGKPKAMPFVDCLDDIKKNQEGLKLTKKESEELSDYVAAGDNANDALRAGDKWPGTDVIDRIFDKTPPLDKPIVLRRVIMTDMHIPSEGKSFVDKAYTSTTATHAGYKEFVEDVEDNFGVPMGELTHLDIEIPAGAKVLHPAAEFIRPELHTAFGHQDEVILPRNTKFLVKQVTNTAGRKEIRLEAVFSEKIGNKNL